MNTEPNEQSRAAAVIAYKVLADVAALCLSGSQMSDICEEGDRLITEGCSGLLGGIAMPTCISLNGCIQYCSPRRGGPPIGEPDSCDAILCSGDVAKLELGVRVNGFPCLVGHTLIVEQLIISSAPITGPIADSIAAAYYACELAQRMIRPGVTAAEFVAAANSAGAAFNCVAVPGVSSVRMSQNNPLAGNEFMLAATKEQKKNQTQSLAFKFEEGETYVIRTSFSAYDHKESKKSSYGVKNEINIIPREHGSPCLFRRDLNRSHQILHMAASKKLLSTLQKDPTKKCFPFAIQSLEQKLKVGLLECNRTGLIVPYSVNELRSSIVASFTITLILNRGGDVEILGSDKKLAIPHVFSKYELPENLLSIINFGNQSKMDIDDNEL